MRLITRQKTHLTKARQGQVGRLRGSFSIMQGIKHSSGPNDGSASWKGRAWFNMEHSQDVRRGRGTGLRCLLAFIHVPLPSAAVGPPLASYTSCHSSMSLYQCHTPSVQAKRCPTHVCAPQRAIVDRPFVLLRGAFSVSQNHLDELCMCSLVFSSSMRC